MLGVSQEALCLQCCSSSCPSVLQHWLRRAGMLPTADGGSHSTGDGQTAPQSPQVWKLLLSLIKLARASKLFNCPLTPSPTWLPGLKRRFVQLDQVRKKCSQCYQQQLASVFYLKKIIWKKRELFSHEKNPMLSLFALSLCSPTAA